LLPFLALSLLQWRRNDLARQWQTLIAPHLLPRMVVRGSQRRLFSPLWVSVLLSPLLVVALAGPSWERGDSPFAQDNAALVIAVDLSRAWPSRTCSPAVCSAPGTRFCSWSTRAAMPTRACSPTPAVPTPCCR
jgi:Ca-activated chloride channel family protein